MRPQGVLEGFPHMLAEEVRSNSTTSIGGAGNAALSRDRAGHALWSAVAERSDDTALDGIKPLDTPRRTPFSQHP